MPPQKPTSQLCRCKSLQNPRLENAILKIPSFSSLKFFIKVKSTQKTKIRQNIAFKGFFKKTSSTFVCKMFKLRKEKMEKIKDILSQLSSNGNRMTGEIERQRLQSEKSEQLHVSHLSVPPSEQLHVRRASQAYRSAKPRALVQQFLPRDAYA